MHAAIADKREELAALCRRYHVARLEVFGSAARGEDFDPETSDADFLVEFDPGSSLRPFHRYFDLTGALREALNRLWGRRTNDRRPIEVAGISTLIDGLWIFVFIFSE
ncbi:MAG: DNA polymerase III subunit beta [Alphaproteobacteria bacterium]|nr:DNA polymerase III subunit beta [Alphaproteobacteria bacterium]